VPFRREINARGGGPVCTAGRRSQRPAAVQTGPIRGGEAPPGIKDAYMTGNTGMNTASALPSGIDIGFPEAERSAALGICISQNYATPLTESINNETESNIKTARRLRWQLQETIADLLPRQRVSRCCRRRVGAAVGIHRVSDGPAFFSGLETCSSVWVCPVCSAKITERRRLELKEAMSKASALGLKAFLLTLTYRHARTDDLATSLEGFSKARRLFRNRKKWKKWALRVGFLGSVYCLEVTHSECNGWHIHSHEIVFLNPGQSESLTVWNEELLPSWRDACVTAGLGEPNAHGLHIQNAESASGYLSTWSVELELTKAFSKKGRLGSRTPWDLARDFQETGDCRSAERFREFAAIFKGKKQLVWSRNLRADLGMGKEKTDQEIAEEVDLNGTLVCSLSPEQWRLVLAYKARGLVLQVAQSGGEKGVEDFVGQLQRLSAQAGAG
jgi:hypothetical protein